jgi:hypothetical protein
MAGPAVAFLERAGALTQGGEPGTEPPAYITGEGTSRGQSRRPTWGASTTERPACAWRNHFGQSYRIAAWR